MKIRSVCIWVATFASLVAIGFAFNEVARLNNSDSRLQKSGHDQALPNTSTALKQFIRGHDRSKDKKLQDVVAQARIHLGFLEVTADHKEVPTKASFALARNTFLTAAQDYKGTGKSSADFGSLPDQALYQADVCLVAEGKKAEAMQAFRSFMKERPTSPLCKACFDRLRRMEGGFKDGAFVSPADQKLFQHDLNSQENLIEYQTSLCGPKCVSKLLQIFGEPVPSIAEIARGCGRSREGTTIFGLRTYLQKLGIKSYAVALNAADFNHLQAPAILSVPDHFIVITKIFGDQMQFYDPLSDTFESRKLPSSGNPTFLANVITFSPPSINNNN